MYGGMVDKAARPGGKTMFQRILVPLDGSRRSAQALPYAIEMARRFSADIVLMRVVRPPTSSGSALAGGDSAMAAEMVMEQARDREKKSIDRATRYVKGKLQSVENQGIKGSFRVVLGDPARSVLNSRRDEGVDLVIMTTRGRGGLRRAIMGSVADEVVRHSRVPILMIRQTRRKT
jgi:nucleotide-binding universal stress UspA family protein